jgi:hypothetical protein
MKKEDRISPIAGWIFGLIVFAIGVLNMILVHPVPGLIYILLSFVYFPSVNNVLRKRVGFTIPPLVKIVLGIFVTWFTLGISDLGDMID